MNQRWLFGLIGSFLVAILVSRLQVMPEIGQAPAVSETLAKASLTYEVVSLPQTTVHLLRIPMQGQYELVPVVAATLTKLDRLAQSQGAIAAINGGFFDPKNQQTTSFVTIDGKLVADPRQNTSLMTNPTVAPYMSRILNRSEIRHYRCGQVQRYAIALHRDPVPSGCQLKHALGAGPQLLPQLNQEDEGFVDASIGRDALGSQAPNARSALGINRDGSLVLVMATQNQPGQGLSLPDLATFLKQQNVDRAINLDGGSSSAMYYGGKVIPGKIQSNGTPVQRSIKSAIIVRQR